MDSGIFRRENEGGQEAEEESAMPMSELPRDFLIEPQPTEADFQIPDDAERLTRPKKPQTIKKIGEIASRLETNPNATQYLLLTDMSVSLRKYLLNERIRGLRFTFDDRKILLRIMPSGQHECVIGQFTLSFGDAMTAAGLPSSGERWLATNARELAGLNCSKQPDFSIIPRSHPNSTFVSKWPSLVVEVGMSQSKNSLRNDAQWWYSNSNYHTRLILLFKVHKGTPFRVDVELWSAPIVPQSRVTRQGGKPLLSLTQDLRVTQDAVTLVKGSSPDIKLDYKLLMRENGQGDITITQKMLQRACQDVRELDA